MNRHHHRSDRTIEINTRLVTAGAVLTAAGAVLAGTGLALASLAVFTAGRRMIHRMEVAPGQQAAVKWQQAKEASRAGVQAWQATSSGTDGSMTGQG